MHATRVAPKIETNEDSARSILVKVNRIKYPFCYDLECCKEAGDAGNGGEGGRLFLLHTNGACQYLSICIDFYRFLSIFVLLSHALLGLQVIQG